MNSGIKNPVDNKLSGGTGVLGRVKQMKPDIMRSKTKQNEANMSDKLESILGMDYFKAKAKPIPQEPKTGRIIRAKPCFSCGEKRKKFIDNGKLHNR